jgi:hypothetical protein
MERMGRMGVTQDALSNIGVVFGGEIPVLVTDDRTLLEALEALPFEAVLLDELEVAPPAVALLGTDFARLGRRNLSQTFMDSRVLWMPLASFDPSLEAAIYSTTLLLESDFESAVGLNRQWTSTLIEWEGELRFEGPGTSITCLLGDPLPAATQLDVQLAPGQWRSVGGFNEVSIQADREDITQSFHVNGALYANGLATARHAGMPKDIIPLHSEACELIRTVAESGEDVRLDIEASRVTHCWVGNEDIYETLRRLTNPEYDMHILEFAVGTNHFPSSKIDWSINSQMNEGAGGIHVGIGEGLTGAHIDFISLESEWVDA